MLRKKKRARDDDVGYLQDTTHLPDVIINLIRAFTLPIFVVQTNTEDFFFWHEGAASWQVVPVPVLPRPPFNSVRVQLDTSWGNSEWATVSGHEVMIKKNGHQSQGVLGRLYQHRVNHQACCIGDKLYIVGGTCGTQSPMPNLEIFDKSGLHVLAPSIPGHSLLDHFLPATWRHYIYIFGGIRAGGKSEEEPHVAELGVSRFNCENNSWSSSEPSDGTITNQSHIAVVRGDSIVIVGNCSRGDDDLLSRTFFPTRKRRQWVRGWSKIPELLVPCRGLTII